MFLQSSQTVHSMGCYFLTNRLHLLHLWGQAAALLSRTGRGLLLHRYGRHHLQIIWQLLRQWEGSPSQELATLIIIDAIYFSNSIWSAFVLGRKDNSVPTNTNDVTQMPPNQCKIPSELESEELLFLDVPSSSSAGVCSSELDLKEEHKTILV